MRYLILGASATGINAAKTIRELDSAGEITVISRDEQIHSRCMLHHVISGERSPEKTSFVEADFFKRYNVRWLAGREIISLDTTGKKVRLSNGEEERYDRLLIATGASSVLPPVTGLSRGKQVRSLRDLADARAIAGMAGETGTAAVIGAGLVGMDAAYALVRCGVKVSVIEVAGQLLPLQLDQRAAENYEQLCRQHNMEFFFNEMVESVILDAQDNVQGLKLKSGKTIPCCMVIVAAGVRPNIEFLAGTPIETGRGVRVNEFQETSLAGVFAAGDVCESRETFTGKVMLTPIWPAAVKQGQVAGSNMAGVSKRLEDNFAFRNAMTFFGLPTVSFGFINPPDESYRVLIDEDANAYKKVILQDGRIKGAVLQGDITGAGLLAALIKEGIDLTNYQERVFSLTYADFFAQKENGTFYFII
ncbi:Pyridine nucleotide-disulphide oxidoreductase [Desulfotomaculum arcticum]|uniref:Pyridine nucleotide-disulphide oxidoreductase n=1 Tax=Desulfotruncus arcticus DSM 17038 TaxID=1121424 RepID=A0A1I2Q4L6_9FIRM|nr:FAD-dependent oxidoreductase [Desulfotruncus arcticus]SFG22870.1 Pyridine nucleotide-disulphide oxidoreductase [Desulfotomaculum arcticum] [Desulfotruncus arcticus DSM 17038]